MPNLPEFKRPISEKFHALIQDYGDAGMKVIPVDAIGSPEQLRSRLELTEEDFVVGAFMGSRVPKGMKNVTPVVRGYTRLLAQLDDQHHLNMPRLSGGGNWNPLKPEANGLMAQWARGATEDGYPAHFVTMQGLIELEGLPCAPGASAFLKQLDDEKRIGERTDGLLCVGDMFLVFPGGLGTVTELCAMFTNSSISRSEKSKKAILFDPIFENPKTGEVSRYWELFIKLLVQQNDAGLIGNDTMRNINNHCVVYRPDSGLSPKQVTRELLSLTLAIRDLSREDNLHPEFRKTYSLPLSTGSHLARVFPDHDANGTWVNDLDSLMKPKLPIAKAARHVNKEPVLN